ncbi:hypothetical protein [Mesobacillus subterraneus]|uniref:hypothetical protein n=1 Tax=Mesobacillus subterraneus TaxID=285983 RepID=UPI001CFD731B|nr:hypothetical protein [Mesobacillus subterraneus]
MKKAQLIILSIFLVINTFMPGFALANADVTKPVFESIGVDRTEATPGDTVKVSISASDDVGIKKVFLYYYTPVTNKVMDVEMSFNNSENAYEGYISIPDNFEEGLYKVQRVSIYDTSDNTTVLYGYENPALASGHFEVMGTNGADVTNPVFESISVDKVDVTPGDTVKISVKASDDIGIKRVFLYYYTPVTNKIIDVSMSYNTAANAFEGFITIPDNFEEGSYKVQRVSIYDTSDNRITLYGYESPNLNTGWFNVTGTSGADITKPVFQSIYVDNSKSTFGDSVKVHIKAIDDVGIKRVFLYYYTPITNKLMDVPMIYNNQTDTYEGSINIASSFEHGIYKVQRVSIYDTSDNRITLYGNETPALGSGQFDVFSESNPPTFSGLSINKNTVENGEYIKFQVAASDDTNLQDGSINLLSPSGSIKEVPLSFNNSENMLTGSFLVQDTDEVGRWIVDSIEIRDTNQNTLFVNNNEADLTSGDFEIIQAVPPLEAYFVQSSESWSNKTVNTDVYISQGSILTINGNVTINGNIYALGGLRSYGGLTVTGKLIANSIYWGYYTPSNGQAVFSGSNSISNMTATNRILSEVPFVVHDTPLITNDGYIDLIGATLPFVSVMINGQSINLKSNGTFRMNEFNVEETETLDVKITDPYGIIHSYTFPVSDIHIDEFTKNSSSITGKTHPDSIVKIHADGVEVSSVNSDENGRFSLAVLEITEHTLYTFNVYSQNGTLIATSNQTAKDMTPPVSQL